MQLSQLKPSKTSLSLFRRNPDTFRQKKTGHKEKDIQKSVRRTQDICLFEFPLFNLIWVPYLQFAKTDQLAITYIYMSVCVCEHTVRLTDRLPHIIYAAYVKTYSLAHPTSYTICNSGYFLGSKAAGVFR